MGGAARYNMDGHASLLEALECLPSWIKGDQFTDQEKLEASGLKMVRCEFLCVFARSFRLEDRSSPLGSLRGLATYRLCSLPWDFHLYLQPVTEIQPPLRCLLLP